MAPRTSRPRSARASKVAGALVCALTVSAGCHLILGSGDFVDAGSGGQAAGPGTGGGDGGQGGSTGACTDGCFDGLACVAGTEPTACGQTGADCVACDAAEVCDTGTCRPCEGLECQQMSCDVGMETSITGRVYDPSGMVPLSGALVFIPNAALSPFTDGPSCTPCDPADGDPIVSTLTAADGTFQLTDTPSGDAIPIVVQKGKWRRQLVLPSITACADNPIPDGDLRLARNQTEGDIPKIALATGTADTLECLLHKMIDTSEFTDPAGTGRVNLYVTGNGAPTSAYATGGNFPAAATLWGSVNTLGQYDLVLLGCEGSQYAADKTPPSLQAVHDYANSGGRMLLDHWHSYWVTAGPAPWPTLAVINPTAPTPPNPMAALIDTSTPEGLVFADWAIASGASVVQGAVSVANGRATYASVDPTLTHQWMYYGAPAPSVQAFSFETPVDLPPAQQCGRVVLTAVHAQGSAGGIDQIGPAFPGGCISTTFSPQELALLYLLFDMSVCTSN